MVDVHNCVFGRALYFIWKRVVLVRLGRALCLCIWARVVLVFWLGVYLHIWRSIVHVYIFTFDITREILKFIIDKRNILQISVKSDDRAVETGQ